MTINATSIGWPVVVALGLCLPACTVADAKADDARFELFVLGRAQDGAVPHLGCERACCAAARAERRFEYPASLGVHDRETDRLLLIEATPFVEPQIALLHRLSQVEGRGRQPVDAVLLTHAHIGHYLGLAQFGREVASTPGIPVHVSQEMAAFLRGNGPWSQLVDLGQIELHVVAPGVPFEPLPGLRVEAVAVPHRPEFSDTLAFRISGPDRTVLFVPDIDRWADGLLARLLEGVDVAYLDGSFHDGSELPDRSLDEVPHPPMIVTMDLLEDAAATRPGAIRFIHLNHTNPALRDPAVVAEIERRGFRVARQGERVGL